MSRRRVVSMRLIISLAAALLVTVVLLVTGQVSLRFTRVALRTAAQGQALLEAHNLALVSGEALLSEFPELTLVPLVTELTQNRDEISFAAVIDHQGVVQGDPDPRRVGTPYEHPRDLRAVAGVTSRRGGEILWESDALLVAQVPVSHGGDQVLGSAVVGLSKAPLEARIAAARRRISQLAAIALPLAALLAAGLMSYLLRPVAALRAGLARIGQGDLDTPMRLRDVTEFGLLGDAVNNLATDLKVSRELAEAREREVVETQLEIILTLGQVVESRSSETAHHVRRVGDMCHHLARLAGLSPREALLLRQASPMHDIGKIGIPDQILNKPGKLTEAEYDLMKTHSEIGHRILGTSNRPILKAAAIVALNHHERWDGFGYPRGLAGEEIPIYGRIVGLVDVFDAMYSDRVYRPAMPLEEVLEIIAMERGRHFEPRLVDLFLTHLDEFLALHGSDTGTVARIPTERVIPGPDEVEEPDTEAAIATIAETVSV